jgi:hypothetical protein
MRQLDFTHVLAALAGVVLTLAGMGVFMLFMPDANVNEQLAQTTQQAVESADEAHQQSVTMHAAIGRYRLIGAGVGIAAALGLAGLALWLAWRSELEAVEVLEQVDWLDVGAGPSSLDEPNRTQIPARGLGK